MSSSLNDRWNQICEKAASYDDVSTAQFKALMTRVHPQAEADGYLLITADNSFIKSRVDRDFLSIIQRAAEDLYHIPFFVEIEVDEIQPETNPTPAENAKPAPTASTSSQPIQQTASPQAATQVEAPTVQLQGSDFQTSNQPQEAAASGNASNADPSDKILPDLTFENFVIGESNRMAYSMALQVAEFPGNSTLNPLFIYGNSGLGKTHLMLAIKNLINQTRPELKTIYADTQELISRYSEAGAEKSRDKLGFKKFKDYYESADVLFIDDIQFLQGRTGTIDITFQIFNKLINQGKQIVLSADRSPRNIDIDERNISRFMQGGMIDIQPPEVETKLAIIKRYIEVYKKLDPNANITIPAEVEMYIAENSGSNIRELKSAINRLVYHMIFSNKEDITVTEVKPLLENYFTRGMSRNITIEEIQKEVAKYYKVSVSDLIGKSRSSEVVFPRQISMYICRQLLDQPFNVIGKKFNKDHSTVIHSISKIDKLLLTDRNVQEEIEALTKIIKNL